MPGVFSDGPDQAARSFKDWWAGVRQLVSPFSIVPQVQRAIGVASNELIIHAAWLGVAEIQESMVQVAERGVGCTVIGTPASPQNDWPDIGGNVKVIATGDLTDAPMPVAVIADGFQAMSMDRIDVHTPGGREIELRVASIARTGRIEELRQPMLQAAAVAG